MQASGGTEPRWGVAGRPGDAPDVVRKSSVAEVSWGEERGSGGKTPDGSRVAGERKDTGEEWRNSLREAGRTESGDG